MHQRQLPHRGAQICKEFAEIKRFWNELPDNIKAADSVQNFKKQLKTLLFRKEFN